MEAHSSTEGSAKSRINLLILGGGPIAQAFTIRCGNQGIKTTLCGPGDCHDLPGIQAGKIKTKGTLVTGRYSDNFIRSFPVSVSLDIAHAISAANYILIIMTLPARHQFLKQLGETYDFTGKVLGSTNGAEDAPLIVKYTNASYGVGFACHPIIATIEDGMLYVQDQPASIPTTVVATTKEGTHPDRDGVLEDLKTILTMHLLFMQPWEAFSRDPTLDLYGVPAIVMWNEINAGSNEPFVHHMNNIENAFLRNALHSDKWAINKALGWSVPETFTILNGKHRTDHETLFDCLNDRDIVRSLMTSDAPEPGNHRDFKHARSARLWKKLGRWLGIPTPAIDRLFADAFTHGVDLWEGEDLFDKLGIKDLRDFAACYSNPDGAAGSVET
ncbi:MULTISPECIES: hypothetical protein [unclassified Neorhizobium]|uniref:hypothetical protein n=1 Tax=unclassified Neorhizobium TaxID=2629175 RepID=UPI001FF254E8|nr:MULTISPECIES: hypothetical protein [unclassified Neorhizobium]MCJ9670390.1 hypothetical protein [Neorhizobium sp. SHOUNA12B]MCJ9746297.1 hypothetical protein [Neorhizobium sp. SHOUNA12A]